MFFPLRRLGTCSYCCSLHNVNGLWKTLQDRHITSNYAAMSDYLASFSRLYNDGAVMQRLSDQRYTVCSPKSRQAPLQATSQTHAIR